MNTTHTEIQSSYKLIIEEPLNEKIKYLCKQIPKKEWSGVLFYNTTGTFENNDLIVQCIDLLIMNIGEGTFTSYTENLDIVSYIVDNPELINCHMGLIHSHCNFETFFSGTDMHTLIREGNEQNHFVSLIVNNIGNAVAKITRKVIVNYKVTEKVNYNSFGNTKVSFNKKHSFKKEKVEHFDLDIIKPDILEESNSLALRIKELQEEEEIQKPFHTSYKQPTLFDFENRINPLLQASSHIIEKDNTKENYDDDETMPENSNLTHQLLLLIMYGQLMGKDVKTLPSPKEVDEYYSSNGDVLSEEFINKIGELIIDLCNEEELLYIKKTLEEYKESVIITQYIDFIKYF